MPHSLEQGYLVLLATYSSLFALRPLELLWRDRRVPRLWKANTKQPLVESVCVCPAKDGILEPFIYKNDHFAKTGSGQT